MNKINPDDVAKRYNDLETIIDDDDKWHLITKDNIREFIQRSLSKLSHSDKFYILNAGSAGYSYGLAEDRILHVDISDKHISHLSNSIVANIENLPLKDQEFDLVICVGSVLNYCDPFKVIEQFSRLLKPKGYIILEFESSYTFELVFKKGFNQSAVFIETFFDAHGDKEQIWYFSEKYIRNILNSYDFSVINRKRFHIISPLVYRLTKKATFSSQFSSFDSICSCIPWIRNFCSNAIYLLQKN